MKLSVSLGYWQDRPPEEALATAIHADRLGYPELWLGEMATYDAFALATAVGLRTTQIGLTVGPLAVSVRDPMSIARGAASVAALTGRRVDVAIGTSSPVVVSAWHGRDRSRAGRALQESAVVLRQLLDGEKSDFAGSVVSSSGYRLRLAPPKSSLTIAAFGAGAVKTAALYGDRLVLNLLTPASAGALVSRFRSESLGPVAAWLATAVDPAPDAIEQLRRGVVPYLAAPGYGEMFIEAGFGSVVRFARTGPHPRALLDAVPVELVKTVCLLGSADEIRARIAEYEAAGVAEIALVPSSVDSDPGGARTLAGLR
ncbi:LLM class F420-dependent oxidoreductase [Actinocrispum sp. NPDC049592]|uniref:LLM class F420-dependent oxidoreductase n=1 Tax=Actinocrispum sp. NPDC049592 TaxID=3154835 RepID=UPI00342B55B4